jgi:hypothetical protein
MDLGIVSATTFDLIDWLARWVGQVKLYIATQSRLSHRTSASGRSLKWKDALCAAFPSRDKSLSQEILLLAGGIIVQHAEQLVSHCFIEAARLKGS